MPQAINTSRMDRANIFFKIKASNVRIQKKITAIHEFVFYPLKIDFT